MRWVNLNTTLSVLMDSRGATLTPAGSILVGFMFLALDQIGRDLERPF